MKSLFNFIKSKRVLLFSIITLSLPAIIEMALNTMLGIADTIMISQFVGKEGLSAVGFANQIIFTLIFVFSSFNTGATALISRAYGEKDYPKLKRIAEQNVVLNLGIGILICFIAYLSRNYIFKIFAVSDEVFQNTVTYFSIVLISFVPMFLSFSYAAILRGSGNTKTPMKITAFVNVLNIIGNYLLILGVGIFPKMGIAGAALSTSLSRIVAVLIYIYIIYIKDSKIKLKVELFLNKTLIQSLWKISFPGAVEQGVMQLAFVVLGVIVSQLDVNSEAAFRILIQIESLSFMPAVGVSIATATLVGKSLGEEDAQKALESGYLSSILGVFWGVIIGLIFVLIPNLVLNPFSSNDSIIALSLTAMPVLALNQLGLNFMIVMSGALRGAGDTMSVLIYTFLRLWVFFVPLSYLFIIRLDYGIVGLWYGELISFLIFSAVIFLRFKSRKWAELEVG